MKSVSGRERGRERETLVSNTVSYDQDDHFMSLIDYTTQNSLNPHPYTTEEKSDFI